MASTIAVALHEIFVATGSRDVSRSFYCSLSRPLNGDPSGRNTASGMGTHKS